MEKIKGLAGSLRFWLLMVIAVIGVFEQFDVVPKGTGQGVADIIQQLLGAIVAIRTVDKFKK